MTGWTTKPLWLEEAQANVASCVKEAKSRHIADFSWNSLPTEYPVEEGEVEGSVYDFSAYSDEPLWIQNEQQVYVEQLPMSLIEAGVVMMDLQEALFDEVFSEKLRPYMEQPLSKDQQSMVHFLHNEEGMLLYIPDHTVIQEPIHLQFLQEQLANWEHVVLLIGENCQLSLKENWEYKGNTYNNQAVQLILGANSQLDYFSQSIGEGKGTTFLQRDFVLQQDSQLTFRGQLLNSGVHVECIDVHVEGSGAKCMVDLSTYGATQEKKVVDVQILQSNHHTESDLVLRGLAAKKGKVLLNATSHIQKNAPYSSAVQKSDLLLAEEKSGGTANPILLIDNNEVKANHAAAIGALSEDKLYYMLSRGLTYEMAVQLYAKGFLAQNGKHDEWLSLWARKEEYVGRRED